MFIPLHLHVANAPRSGKFCPQACDLTLNYATFNDTDAWLSKKVRSCRSELRTTSLYLCFSEYCTNDGEAEKWIESQSQRCDELAGVVLPAYHDVVDKWSSLDRAGLRRLDVETAISSPVLGVVVVPDEDFFERAFTTMDVAFSQYDLHLIYGWYMYYFWILVVTIGISTRLVSLIRQLERHPPYQPVPRDESNYVAPKSSGGVRLLHAWLNRWVTIPATFGNRCSQPYGWCTIPPRIQSLTILVFVLLNFVLCTCNYELTDGNLYWPEKSTQLLRYVSDRTGIISLANFPLVWLFGMRNDVLIWLTGWGFGTYNAFHRWVARVATLQAVVHSLGYTVMILQDGGWSGFLEYWPMHYFWNGELATIAMCALLAFSLYGIRRAHYEIFLVTHIVLSIVALWTMYYHVEIFTGGEWNTFIWPCLVIWVLDRALRAGRIIAFSRCFWNTKATVHYDPASNLVRMDVDASNTWLKPKPGTYYFIHVLDNILFAHQGHPFTLIYTSSSHDPSPPIPLSPRPPQPHHTPSSSSSSSSSESSALLRPPTTASKTLTFLIRPYASFTARLQSHCLPHPTHLRVLLDGPYTHSAPLHLFPTILFVVGGTGIAIPLSHLASLLSATSHAHTLKVVWAVREYAFFANVLRDFKSLLGDERVNVDVHVTQEVEGQAEGRGEHGKSVRVWTGRPDVCAAVRRAARGAGGGRCAVVACGPGGMADRVRGACVEVLGEGAVGVEYFEESFKW